MRPEKMIVWIHITLKIDPMHISLLVRGFTALLWTMHPFQNFLDHFNPTKTWLWINEQAEHLNQRSTNIDYYKLLYTNIPRYFGFGFQLQICTDWTLRGYNFSTLFSSIIWVYTTFLFLSQGGNMVTDSQHDWPCRPNSLNSIPDKNLWVI